MRLEVRFWIADPVNGVNNVRSDVNRAIWRLFRTHGVHIPVPQRDLRMRADSGRRAPPGGSAPGAPGVPGVPGIPGFDRAAD
jgi:small-conductance mechanosensitive channel